MKLTREQYRELYPKLPREIFDFVYSDETSKKIYDLCIKHKLHMDDAGVVHDIVMDTAMGIIATKNMEGEIIKELKLNPLDVSQLVREIDNEVLAPVKETMINTYKHSNPFKPQTLLHVDETDEPDETSLNRNDLLAEIENPAQSRVRKVTPNNEATISSTVVNTHSLTEPEKTKVEEPQIDNTLKLARERMLGLFKDDKLSNVVTMNAHIQSVPTPQNEPIATKTSGETAPIKEPAPQIPVETKPTVSEVVYIHEELPKKIINESITIVPKPIETTAPTVKKVDPYRETI